MMTPIQNHLWNPLRAFQALQAELERSAASPFRRAAPPVALYRREDRVLIQALVPGLAPEALRVEVDGDTLTLAGQWSAEPTEGVRAQHLERPRGAFERRLRMPFEIDPAHVEARLQNGVLEVELVREPRSAPVKIEVRSQSEGKS